MHDRVSITLYLKLSVGSLRAAQAICLAIDAQILRAEQPTPLPKALAVLMRKQIA